MEFTSTEMEALNKISEELIGISYMELLKFYPEEADNIYCYAEDNNLI